jgi:hypothetical protein
MEEIFFRNLNGRKNGKALSAVTSALQNDNLCGQRQQHYTFIAIDVGPVVGYSWLVRGKLRVILITYWYNSIIGNKPKCLRLRLKKGYSSRSIGLRPPRDA